MKTCMIVGKFMPPHKGHEYMIRFAKNYAQDVHVIVDCLEGQTISPEQRKKWLEEEISGITVHALPNFMPQDPSDTPQFWPIWKSTILKTLGFKPDMVVAAMDYGWELARVLEAQFVPIDIARESLPISATMLRENVYENWDYLMDSVKPHYIKKLCLLGPESTGKSTAAKTLAKQLNTTYVPEYAKAIIEKQNGEFYFDNVDQVALAQINSEKALAKFTNKVMVCDSCAITTKVFSQMLFNTSTHFLDSTIVHHSYDKYALFYPDNHFTDDIHRRLLDSPELKRLEMFESFETILKSMGANYTVIKGSYQEKDAQLLTLAQSLI